MRPYQNRGRESSIEPIETRIPQEHIEEEISLLDIPADFETKLVEQANAQLEIAKRRIRDLRYTERRIDAAASVSFDSELFASSPEEVTELFRYLGYDVVYAEAEGRASFQISPLPTTPQKKSRRTARLRQDGEIMFFTVKGPRLNRWPAKIKARPEYEIKITDEGFEQINDLLQSGHVLKSDVEKDRTTWLLPQSTFDGSDDCKVEIDEYPPTSDNVIMTRAEIEGRAENIEKALDFLEQNNIFGGRTSDLGQTELLRAESSMPHDDDASPLVMKFHRS